MESEEDQWRERLRKLEARKKELELAAILAKRESERAISAAGQAAFELEEFERKVARMNDLSNKLSEM